MGITVRQLEEWKQVLIGEYNEVVSLIQTMSNKPIVNMDSMKYLLTCKKSLENQIKNYDRDDFFYGI